MAIDPSTTAVVLIEYQNDFTSEGGVLHGAVAEVMDKTGMLDNTKRVVEAAREAGATVMHAPITFAEGYNELSSHPYGILKGVVDGNAFVKDSWGAAIVDDLAPAGRRHRDRGQARARHVRQHQPRLHPAQQGHHRRSCSAGSSPTAASSRRCARGYENGYQVITLNDCVAATSIEEHDNALATTTRCSPSR